jgi:Flp pilus assembly protein TadD
MIAAVPFLLALFVPPCEADLEQVTAALQQNDLNKASSLLDAVESSCAQSSNYYALRGVSEEMSGHGDKAEIAFRKAITLDPNSARIREQLGAAYLRNHKPAEAAQTLEAALPLDPNNPALKKFLIGAYVQNERWQQASKLFESIGGQPGSGGDPILLLWFARTLIETNQVPRLERELAPESLSHSSELLFSIGTALGKKGAYRQAIRYLEAIPEKDKDEAVAFNEGLAYSHLREFDLARSQYFQAIDKHANYAEAYFRVGLDYVAQGDQRMAMPWLLRSHQWASERADITYALVEQLVQLKYLKTATQLLDQVAATQDPLLLTARADLQQAKGETSAAETGYRQALAKEPKLAPARIGLARLSAADGKEDQARMILQQLVAENPEDSIAQAQLGLLESRAQNWNAAAQHLSQAWKLDKAHAQTALELARVQNHLKASESALRLLNSLPEQVQASPEYHSLLAQTYARLGRTKEASNEQEVAANLEARTHNGLHFDDPQVYIH